MILLRCFPSLALALSLHLQPFFSLPQSFLKQVEMSSCSSSSSNSLPGSSFGSSHMVEALNASPQIVSRPLGNPRLVVVSSSSGRVAPADSRVIEALAMMKSCSDSDSTLMARRLVEVRERFHIPPEYELHSRWGFRPEWTARSVNHTTPVVLSDESELVGILRGILSSSRAIKDMTEGWLVEAGLSPTPRGMSHLYVYFIKFCNLIFPFCPIEMFNLAKMKSASGVVSHATPPPVTERPTSRAKKHKAATSKRPANAVGGSTKARLDKGKGLTEVEEVPDRGYSLWELCEVDDRAGVD
ncbi:hypothetical protein GW17_00010774 [Ensete ventricosum]|nr:hypothetical protein GW17_00010774 [Ensete ventricosum]